MPATFLEGRRRSGKSLYAVLKIQEYLKEGRRVATNLDLHLENLMPEEKGAFITRIPDFPRSEDLFALGQAYDSLDADKPETYDESKNGIVVLDELLTSFNSRTWSSKDRMNVINWIVLSGKLGWDLIFIGQSFEAVDGQIRDTVIDRIGSCTSNENLYPGFIWNHLVKPIYLKIVGTKHLVFMYYGKAKTKDNFSHKITHKKYELFNCYNTAQVFRKDVEAIELPNGKVGEKDNRAIYSRIGKHYFDKTKEPEEDSSNLKVDHKNKVVTKKETKFTFLNAFLILIIIAMGFLYFTKDTKVVTEANGQVTTQANSPNKSTFKKAKPTEKTHVANSELGIIYISCFVYSSLGDNDYCFKDEQQRTIKPEYIGFQILYVSECHAKIKRKKEIYDVYCNPVLQQSNIEEQQPQLVNNQQLSLF